MAFNQLNVTKELFDLSAAQTLGDLTSATDELMGELELGGYKFCVANAEASGLVVRAVIAGGDLSVAESVLTGQRRGNPEEPLARTYWTQQTVLWSEFISPRNPAPVQRTDGPFEALGVTCGASIPVISRSGRKRASLCVSGAKDEPAELFDRRFPQIAPVLRMSGLAMFEFGLELARKRVATHLSSSEADVLDLLAAGFRPKEIAGRLSKSESTVRNQIAAAREKLGAESALQAVAIWNMRAS